jgi:hypothetical protein
VHPDFRRIVAVAAHRRATGNCPVRVHSLGTGETFDIKPAADGFLDMESGLNVRLDDGKIAIPSIQATIDLKFAGDVWFDGFDHSSGEWFSGRAGGGATVTLYDLGQSNYFQYAVAGEDDRICVAAR